MNKFNDVAVVTVSDFNQGSPDKNGIMPVILTIVAGKAPNRIVLSGTIAQSEGFEVGSTYLASCIEGESDPTYGRQFNWKPLKELTALEIVQMRSELGTGVVFEVDQSTELEIPVSSKEAVTVEDEEL